MNLIVSQLLSVVLAGRHAGESRLACNDPSLAKLPTTLKLHSSAFADGCAMPKASAGSGVGANLSPDLSWERLPDGATHWMLVIEDPDAPTPWPFVHGLAVGPTQVKGLEEGCFGGARAPNGVTFGRNTGRSFGYQGPRPLPGHGPHRYVFQLFALRAAPADLDMKDGLRAVTPTLVNSALATGRLDGTFQRDWFGRPLFYCDR